MTRRTDLVGRGCLVLCIGVLTIVAAGCGGSDDESTPATDTTTTASSFTPAQVEKMIDGSIRPTLAANLGKGSTMRVDCESEDAAFRCDAALFPGGDRANAQHVIYRATCDAKTCEWIPIG